MRHRIVSGFAKFCLIIFFVIYFLAPLAHSQSIGESMNLMEAVKLAFAADNNLKAARANLSASEAAIKSAKAAYFPKLLLTGSYSRMSKANELELSIPPIIERNIEIGTDIPFYANLGMSYELYSFGRRPSIARISRSEKKSSELGYRYARKELFDTVARAYLTTLFAGESLDLIEAETDRFTRIHQLIESRYNQEITPEFDFLQARLRLEHYKLAVLEAANNFEIASLNLARFLNMPVDQLPKLEERIGDSLFSLPQSTDQSEILSRREDLNQSRIVTDLASLAAKINKSAYFPSVSLFGAYDLRNGYQPDVGKVEENYSVGINLNWLLFDGFARRAEISRQTYIQKASGYLTDDLMLTIPFQVNSSQLAIVNSRTRIDVGEEALELARKAMIIAQTRYDLGDITMIELLDIENQRSESELGLLKLQYQYNLSQLNLKLVSSFYPEIELLY